MSIQGELLAMLETVAEALGNVLCRLTWLPSKRACGGQRHRRRHSTPKAKPLKVLVRSSGL